MVIPLSYTFYIFSRRQANRETSIYYMWFTSFLCIDDLYNWVGGIAVLVGLRILHGMSWAVSTTSILTAITDMIPSSRRGEGLGWSGIAMTIAMAIGPMFGIWVTENLSYHLLFLFAFCLSVIALVLILGAKMPFQLQSSSRKIRFFEKSVLPVTITVFFLFVAYGGVTTVLYNCY